MGKRETILEKAREFTLEDLDQLVSDLAISRSANFQNETFPHDLVEEILSRVRKLRFDLNTFHYKDKKRGLEITEAMSTQCTNTVQWGTEDQPTSDERLEAICDRVSKQVAEYQK